VVECDLAKVEVAGSTPVSRSRFLKFFTTKDTKYARRAPACTFVFPLCPLWLDDFHKRARYPSGKGEVCKTFMRRFDSDPRLHSL
jgi:hypothetical protein